MPFYPDPLLDPLLCLSDVLSCRVSQFEDECAGEKEIQATIECKFRIAILREMQGHLSHAIIYNLLFCEMFFTYKIMNALVASEHLGVLAGIEAKILHTPVSDLEKSNIPKDYVKNIIEKCIHALRIAFAVERKKDFEKTIEEWGKNFMFVHKFSEKVISHVVQEWFIQAGQKFIRLGAENNRDAAL